MIYDPNPDPGSLFQGDILSNFPIIVLSSEVRIWRAGFANPIQDSIVDDAYANGAEQLLVKGYRTRVIILSQTCDIEHRELSLVSPVFPIDKIQTENKRTQIRNNKTFYRFPLPEKPDVMDESYVDLTLVNSVPRQALSVGARILSLTDYYRHHLAHKLQNYLCRPFFK